LVVVGVVSRLPLLAELLRYLVDLEVAEGPPHTVSDFPVDKVLPEFLDKDLREEEVLSYRHLHHRGNTVVVEVEVDLEVLEVQAPGQKEEVLVAVDYRIHNLHQH
jgi:hypothetical protein